jgi:hypothetical protein
MSDNGCLNAVMLKVNSWKTLKLPRRLLAGSRTEDRAWATAPSFCRSQTAARPRLAGSRTLSRSLSPDQLAVYQARTGRSVAPTKPCDTLSMNPKADREEIAEAYENDPQAAMAEFGAQFRDDLIGFISLETLEELTVHGRSRGFPGLNMPPWWIRAAV